MLIKRNAIFYFLIKMSLVEFLREKFELIQLFVDKQAKSYFNQAKKMLGNMVNCVKGLFGLDGEDYEDKNFVLCESSCLCSESTSEPICTSPDIIQEYCPEDKFQLEPSFPTTTTTVSSISSTPPLLELDRSFFVEPTPTYEGSATESLVPMIII
jgi:hypothetical protein